MILSIYNSRDKSKVITHKEIVHKLKTDHKTIVTDKFVSTCLRKNGFIRYHTYKKTSDILAEFFEKKDQTKFLSNQEIRIKLKEENNISVTERFIVNYRREHGV
jgi:hypothetical protein